MAKEEIILDLQVNQGDAISDLEKTKASIIGLKKEQQELNKAYKQGDITLEEYASDSVRLEGILKKQQSTYNNLQKSVTGVKTQLDKVIESNTKLVESNKKISSSFQDAASKINVAGVSIGDVGSKISGLLNPATAAAGLVTTLGALYLRSARGAEDFARAQSTLNATLDVLSNKVGGGSGTGFAEKAAIRWEQLLTAITSNTKAERAATEENIAIAKIELETIKDLEVERIKAAANAKNREREAENARRDRDDSEKTFEQRRAAQAVVTEKLTGLEAEQVGILKQQIRALINYGEVTGSITEGTLKEFDANGKILDNNITNREVRKSILILQQEISDKQEEINGKLTENVMSLRSINKEESDIAKKKNDEAKKQKELRNQTLRDEVTQRGAGNTPLSDVRVNTGTPDFKAMADKEIQLAKKTDQEITDEKRRQYDIQQEMRDMDLEATQMYYASLATLATTFFGENSAIAKTFAIAEATINTYRGANLALGTLPPPLSFATAALTIATGLANVAQISGIAAAGGTDFVTTGPKLLLVGDNPGGRERVTVEPLSGKGKTRSFGAGYAMAGGGSLTIDGGASMNESTSGMNQSLAMANALKNMPPAEVSVKEITKTQTRVRVKEKLATR